MNIDVTEIETPIGRFRTGSAGDAVVISCFIEGWDRRVPALTRRYWKLALREGKGRPEVARAVACYFDGDTSALDELGVETLGTPFQQRVWSVLREIPTGETRSYADVAAEVGAPGAVRAVGTANGANPVGLIVPCHRVVRSDGALGGYGGGVDRKAWLLEHEGRIHYCARARTSWAASV